MNDDEKGGEGRGLPVGFKWAPSDLGAVLCDGGGTVLAEVTRAGYWTTYDARGSATGSGFDAADGAAAQREAVAALWRVDGFGVGEVRGLVLGDEWTLPVGFALDAPKPSPMALPGLSGLWTLTRVSNARPITVDAVRAPVVEPVPTYPADLCGCCWVRHKPGENTLCEGWRTFTAADEAEARARGMKWIVDGPKPKREPSCADRGPAVRVWLGTPPPGWGPGMRPPCLACGAASGEPCADPDTKKREPGCLCHLEEGDSPCPVHPSEDDAEPAPREPSAPNLHKRAGQHCPGLPHRASEIAHPASCAFHLPLEGDIGVADDRAAPTDTDEPARLLPGLHEDVAHLRARAHYTDRLARVLDACELLLAERADLRSDLALERRGATTLREWLDLRTSQRDAARARVAELEAALAGMRGERDDERVISQGWEVKAEEAEQRVAALEATPPPGTVAALLAKVEEARDTARDKRGDHDGESPMAYRYEGMRDAFDIAAGMVRATLGAPTPLDRAVVELVAMDTRGLLRADITIAGMLVQIGEHVAAWEEHPHTARDTLCNIARVALAGMLACDAAPCRAALMHSTLGKEPCIERGEHAEHKSAKGQRWGGETMADHPNFDTRTFFDDGAAHATKEPG
jgi:hypothetical protein